VIKKPANADTFDAKKPPHLKQPPTKPPRKSKHNIKRRVHYIKTCITQAIAAIKASCNMPLSYQEATLSPDTKHWLKATQEEFDALVHNKTFSLVPLPPGRKALGMKIVFKVKVKADRTPERYKAWIVAQGFRQRLGVDYFETYAPVLSYDTLHYLLALAILLNLEIYQLNVNSAFLQAFLNEEVFMRQPEGFIDPNKPHFNVDPSQESLQPQAGPHDLERHPRFPP